MIFTSDMQHAPKTQNFSAPGSKVFASETFFSSAERKEFLRPWGLDIRSWLSCVKLLGGSIPTKPWEVYVRANGLVDGDSDSWWLDSWTYKVAKTFKKLQWRYHRIRMLFHSLIQFKSSSWVVSVGSPCACHIHIHPRIHKRLTTYGILLEYF